MTWTGRAIVITIVGQYSCISVNSILPGFLGAYVWNLWTRKVVKTLNIN